MIVVGSFLISVKMKKKRQKKRVVKKKKISESKIFITCLIIFCAAVVFIAALGLIISKKQDSAHLEQPIVMSPENKTYDFKNIPINVYSDEILLSIVNSFDNGPNIAGCLRCNGYGRYDLNFEKGQHTANFYFTSADGRVTKTTVVFTVE